MMSPVAVHDGLAGHFARMDPDVQFFYALVLGDDLGALRINQLLNRATREITIFKRWRGAANFATFAPIPLIASKLANCLPTQ